ncbi:MAG TPA: FAD-dependent monooxygenase [Polyangiaceae bacterium]
MIDVVIVGAGPAGSTTALSLLHRDPGMAGRVVMLERARFPREKPCAGAIGERGDKLLRELDAHVDVPSAHVDGISFRCGEGQVRASPGRIGRVVRRIEFDHALVRIAVARGADLREGVRVESVRDEGDAGAVLETSAGTIRARVVVGCDGVGSTVRKALGAGVGTLRAQVVEVDTEPVPGDVDRSLLHFDASDRGLAGYAWDFPTVVRGRELVCRGVYQLRADGARESGEDVATLLDSRLRAMGIDPTACANKRYAERGYEPASTIARGSLMLVGEAAGIDPVTGEGIAQAIEYGTLAGRFLASRPSSADGWSDVLARSRLARDLRIRNRFAHLFYGPDRATVERFFAHGPDALHVGCQHFAAQGYDWLYLGEALARGAAMIAAHQIGRLLA